MGQDQARVVEQIKFVELLKNLSESTSGVLKKNVNEEIKLKAVQLSVKDVFDQLMNSVDGRYKTIVHEEIKTRANAREDIEYIFALKKTLQGVIRDTAMQEILSKDQQFTIQRKFSATIADTVSRLRTRNQQNSVSEQTAKFDKDTKIEPPCLKFH